MARWAVAVVDARGAILVRGTAVYTGHWAKGTPHHLVVTVAAMPSNATLTVGQPLVVRRTPHHADSGVVEALGTNSAGACTVTIALNPRSRATPAAPAWRAWRFNA